MVNVLYGTEVGTLQHAHIQKGEQASFNIEWSCIPREDCTEVVCAERTKADESMQGARVISIIATNINRVRYFTVIIIFSNVNRFICHLQLFY